MNCELNNKLLTDQRESLVGRTTGLLIINLIISILILKNVQSSRFYFWKVKARNNLCFCRDRT